MKLAATLLLYPIATLADDTRRVNFTSYRVTPRLITGLVDHDTGDAAGDVYFALYQLTFPLYCLKMPRDSVCHTKVLANTSDNVYRQSIVEADSRFGVYNGCDPQNNGSFICQPYWRDGTCWYDFEDFKTRFSGICDPHQCTCLAASQSAVGKYSCPMCDGWWHNDTRFWRRLEGLAGRLNGTWYSTRESGQCPPGVRPGLYTAPDGSTRRCFWREAKVLRNVNATCVQNSLVAAVVQHNSACFNACPQPSNRSAVCWVECLLESIVGNVTTTSTSTGTLRGIANHRLQSKAMGGPSGGMTHEQLVQPFHQAFASADPAKGGCPEVKVPGGQ